ncbi:MAG: hypothetical protein ACRCVN_02885 [Spirochaetia bacterium]
MNKYDIQNLLASHPVLNEVQQSQIFALIIDDLLQKTDPCEIYFTHFNIEHFLSGYLTQGCEDSALIHREFCAHIPKWKDTLAGIEYSPQAAAQAVLFIARFLVAKEFYSTAQSLCSYFLKKYIHDQNNIFDKITYDYLVFLSKEQPDIAVADGFKSLQADYYIQKSQNDAREKLTPNFLENPYEPAFYEYPRELHSLMARLFYNQQETFS